ncbi:hypothetical protein F5B20DRAFT_453483 [Whalleya microplaca]|nr:hypothetical protein F5B20DRAFT_453483 [Whalleya microplaca]
MADGPLDVIALVSGGKDSFFSILHCLANGHRVVALANLHPPRPLAAPGAPIATRIPPGEAATRAPDNGGDDEDEADLNSFMYQTVGHQVIPLYAQATGLPLFRQPILGTAVHHGISYQDPADKRPHDSAAGAITGLSDNPQSGPTVAAAAAAATASGTQEVQEQDETESLVPLLRAVMTAHPAANALCTGAILSTYQRTRVESVALRLGLVPLGYLWQFPELPPPISSPISAAGGIHDDAQLLRDMAAVGLEARIVKVASAGLDEDFLWENVASEQGVRRVERALRRFGGGGRGAVLGEGGEFETLVVDGPPALFKGKIVVRDEAKRVVREGGGSVWLSIREATVEMKGDSFQTYESGDFGVRIPDLLDPKFKDILKSLRDETQLGYTDLSQSTSPSLPHLQLRLPTGSVSNWCFSGGHGHATVEDQTINIVQDITAQLRVQSLPATAITNTIIVLRHMPDFPVINKLYGSLFREPNPPARVTISCGDLLPNDVAIAIFLTVQPRLRLDDRRGLHVQSRSYWAPANIGPYSQAIAIPLLGNDEQDEEQQHHTDSPLAVSIAGQIPLIPASMNLPPESPENLALQVTLALQHLWRIGVEMEVQWWSSAVAYFPRTSSSGDMRRNALLAATAWRSAHISFGSTDGDEDEDGPDLWDRKYNPQYMSLASGDGEVAARPALPDFEVLKGLDADDREAQKPVPFMFSAEVEELPRQAGVEWHAHTGFAKVSAGCIQLCSVNRYLAPSGTSTEGIPVDLYHAIVECPDGVFIQIAVVCKDNEAPLDISKVTLDRVTEAVRASLGILTSRDSLFESKTAVKPKLTYVESSRVGDDSLINKAIIPCKSLWDSQGNRLAMISIFETRLTKVQDSNE